MKRIYWRPPGVSRAALLMIALVAVAALVCVESFQVQRKQPWYQEKVAAAQLAREAMQVVKNEKQRRNIPIDREGDPGETGLVGTSLSPITSNTGYLDAKHTSVNPNFAAVIVHLLKRAGVERGDLVAVGLSGSFPALNICTYAAIQTLGLEPLVISSTAASEWGANHPSFTWLDMERVLAERQVLGIRSVAASRGGIDDRGYGMSKEGRSLLDTAIERNGVERIHGQSLADAIDKRMEIYRQRAGAKPIRAYINIGGGSASVGTHIGKKMFKRGLNREPPRGEGLVDSVMYRFASEDIPVIHISGIAGLARRYGLSVNPTSMPAVGEGNVYAKPEYNRWLAAGGILAILAVMLAFIRLDVGMRILRSTRQKNKHAEPQQMV